MKICAIGDPHGDIKKIKKINLEGIDLILITGDLPKADLVRKRFFENIKRKMKGQEELKYDSNFAEKVAEQMHSSTMEIIKYLTKFAPVYSIKGNAWMSDDWAARQEKEFKIKLPRLEDDLKNEKRFHLIKNSIKKFHKIQVGFLEYFADKCSVEVFQPSDYESEMKKAKKETSKAKRVAKKFKKIDILVCHQPPLGVLDQINSSLAPKNHNGKCAGSKVILDFILKSQPKYVFCGHIHEAKGFKKIGNTKVYNLGCTGYKIINI